MRSKWLSSLAVLAAAATVVAAFSIPALAGSGGGRKGLSKQDRQLLAEARAEGKQTVVVLIAAKGGANRAVVTGLEGLGATVRYRDDALGYVSARVPLDKVAAAVSLDGVEALDVDEVIPLDDPRPEGRDQPHSAAGTRRGDTAQQPVHADRRHGRGAVHSREPDIRRSRRHRRHPRLGRLARPPEPAHDDDAR